MKMFGFSVGHDRGLGVSTILERLGIEGNLASIIIATAQILDCQAPQQERDMFNLKRSLISIILSRSGQ
jgi:hypothetical protein